jgi:hypothetical protein
MAWYSAAWPLVTRVVWISQVRVFRCPSASGPSWASKGHQEPAPCDRLDRIGALHRPQPVRQQLNRQLRRRRISHEPHGGLQHLDRFVHVRRDYRGAHGGCVTSFSLIDYVFDIYRIKWVRHFRVRHG